MKLLTRSLALASLLLSGSLSAQQGLGGAGQAIPASTLQCPEVAAALTAVVNQDTRLRDWANLARYREANNAVTRADAVFMGDSIARRQHHARLANLELLLVLLDLLADDVADLRCTNLHRLFPPAGG